MLSAESVAYKVLREIRKDLPRFCGRQIAVSVNARVAEMLLGTGAQGQLWRPWARSSGARSRSAPEAGPAPGAVRGGGARRGPAGHDPAALARRRSPQGAEKVGESAPEPAGARDPGSRRATPTRPPRQPETDSTPSKAVEAPVSSVRGRSSRTPAKAAAEAAAEAKPPVDGEPATGPSWQPAESDDESERRCKEPRLRVCRARRSRGS